MTGFHSKREAAADKVQEPVNLLEARRIAAEYGTPDSQVDDGNLYFALSKCLEHIDALPAQEPPAQKCPNIKNCGGACFQCEYFNAEKGEMEYPVVQPAQEPVAWKTMEAKYPSLEKLDIRMGDGSILCGVWPQSDGDFWWEGAGTGEKFIDPKYADVTHWRVHSDTTPPQREWVGLTTDEMKAVADRYHLKPPNIPVAFRAIEAKLKERNHER